MDEDKKHLVAPEIALSCTERAAYHLKPLAKENCLIHTYPPGSRKKKALHTISRTGQATHKMILKAPATEGILLMLKRLLKPVSQDYSLDNANQIIL